MAQLPQSQHDRLQAVLELQPRVDAEKPIDRSELVETLCQIQDALGFIPSQSLHTISEAFNISRADLYGVISFYDDFVLANSPPDPSIPEIHICRAEACQAVGSRELYKACCDSMSEQIRVRSVYCLGNCALGPAVMIGGRCHGRVDLAKVQQLAMIDKSR